MLDQALEEANGDVDHGQVARPANRVIANQTPEGTVALTSRGHGRAGWRDVLAPAPLAS